MTNRLQTDGSIASPARNNGVVGIKPTSGLVPRSGVYYITEWQDSVGVLANTVLDAAHVLTTIAKLVMPKICKHLSADGRPRFR